MIVASSKIAGADALRDQRKYMESTTFPSDMLPSEAARRAFRMNERTKFLKPNTTPWSDTELNERVISRNLPGTALIEYVKDGGEDLTEKEEIIQCIQLCERIVRVTREVKEREANEYKGPRTTSKSGSQG